MWAGSLTQWNPGSGYWINLTDDIENYTFVSNDSYLRNNDKGNNTNYSFTQSTQQAFYFTDDIGDLDIEIGDIVLVYNKDVLVGSREYNGLYTDIPAMGYMDETTSGYLNSGDVPTFKLVKSNGDVINIEAYVEPWMQNELFMISFIGELQKIPTSHTIISAYPNPFNPTTTIQYSISQESNVLIEVYDINGRMINQLVNSYKQPGYYETSFNAKDEPSGLYFIKLVSENYNEIRKVMLIK